ncbi:putative very-long-chain 3-oxoacyl-CoA reductase [Helianthus annuus]|nr:putative very-long-chain 3-oxoacyl-CoA reductase [Helianthus annuus]
MASIKRSSFFVPSATGYAKAGLRSLGHEPRCTPYWPHSLIWGLLYSLPESVIDAWRYNFCLKIRKRGQLKDSRKKDNKCSLCATLACRMMMKLCELAGEVSDSD